MSRTTSVNFTGANQFPYATAGTDLFVKDDVQLLAKAVDNHTHAVGNGPSILPITATNGAVLAAPGANANQFSITQDLLVARYIDIYATGATASTQSARIRQTDLVTHQGITMESFNNSAMIMSQGASYAGSNTRWDQAWKAYSNAAGALLYVAQNQGVVFQMAPSVAADAVQTFATVFQVDAIGNIVSGTGSAGSATGSLTMKGSTINVGNATAGGHLYFGDCHLSNWNPGQARFYGPLIVNGQVDIGSDFALGFSVNGYTIKGVNGQPYLLTSGSFVVAGGSYYFDSGATVRFFWDGTWLHSNKQLYTDGALSASGSISALSGGNIASTGGNYYAGASNQSQIGMWNPGEWRISTSPGNLYAVGVIQSDQYTRANGSGAQGNGAYVNTASSITVKENIVELDPVTCLNQVLDTSMRPVSFTYTEAQVPLFEGRSSDRLGPDSNEAPLRQVIWTDAKLGFIAEEVAPVVPEAVGTIDGTDISHGLTIESLVPVLWAAVRQLEARIKTLETPV